MTNEICVNCGQSLPAEPWCHKNSCPSYTARPDEGDKSILDRQVENNPDFWKIRFETMRTDRDAHRLENVQLVSQLEAERTFREEAEAEVKRLIVVIDTSYCEACAERDGIFDHLKKDV